MKKQLLFIVAFAMCVFHSYATVYTVQVSNFQFSPSSVNAVVGDTITWTWVNGSHTTTCDPASQSGTSLPVGAATWDNPMTSSSKSFSYKLVVAGTYNYLCIPHAAFGMVGIITASAALPVTLINFTVAAGQNNKALLAWTVADEKNLSYYSIQKSTDGKTFTEAGRVAAGSSSAQQKTYTYTDNTTVNSRYVYYSLKMVDKDGKTQLSPVNMFTNLAVKTGIIVSMSPNPISSPAHLMLQFNADKPGTLMVQLFDMNGKLLKQAEMTAVTGLNNGHFHIGELPAGTYKVIFSMDGKKETKQLQFK